MTALSEAIWTKRREIDVRRPSGEEIGNQARGRRAAAEADVAVTEGVVSVGVTRPITGFESGSEGRRPIQPAKNLNANVSRWFAICPAIVPAEMSGKDQREGIHTPAKKLPARHRGFLCVVSEARASVGRDDLRAEEQGITYIAGIDADNPLASLQAASCTYRIALGSRAGPKVLSMRTVARRDEKATAALCAGAHGFGLHAAVPCGAHQRKELERLYRSITRLAIANERLKRNGSGDVVR